MMTRMRKLGLIATGAAVASIAALLAFGTPSPAQQRARGADSTRASVLAAADTARLRGPRQPIFFRHDLHAGQYKMTCQYCH